MRSLYLRARSIIATAFLTMVCIVTMPLFALAQAAADAAPAGVTAEGLLQMVGLSGGAIGIILLVMKVFLMIGKKIPDSKTGWLGGVRNVCKFLGAYISNVP